MSTYGYAVMAAPEDCKVMVALATSTIILYESFELNPFKLLFRINLN